MWLDPELTSPYAFYQFWLNTADADVVDRLKVFTFKTRAEIEELRGASVSQTSLEALLEAGLVAPRGRKESPGRPVLWGTTPRFLEHFNLRSLAELPRQEDLVARDAPVVLIEAREEQAEAVDS